MKGVLYLADLNFKIVKSLGVVGEPTKTGWTTELNVVTWFDKEPVYDIRAWSPEHTRCGKGISLNANTLKDLQNLLNSVEINELGKK